jgi:two-component system cell cycle response regulator
VSERDGEENTAVISIDERRSTGSAARPPKDICTLTALTGPTQGRMYTVDGRELVFGRGDDCGARIEDASLSRKHARVRRTGDAFVIEDLDSTNGTGVNGNPITSHRLRDGDRVELGPRVLLACRLQDALEQEASKRMYESSVRDALTNVHNRRYLDERLIAEFAFAVRHRTSLCVLIVDADHFKKVNDTYGHMIGDEILKAVAGQMKRVVRAEDLVARYGGEEFCVVARGIEPDSTMVLAERLRRMIEQASVFAGGHDVRVTASVGAATMTVETPYKDVRALLEAADGALYEAKRLGRNRAVHA